LTSRCQERAATVAYDAIVAFVRKDDDGEPHRGANSSGIRILSCRTAGHPRALHNGEVGSWFHPEGKPQAERASGETTMIVFTFFAAAARLRSLSDRCFCPGAAASPAGVVRSVIDFLRPSVVSRPPSQEWDALFAKTPSP
jgi:hypothetical protein